ncbi:MAG: amidohydrolase family protein [Pyrinomonadaceae bacterium]
MKILAAEYVLPISSAPIKNGAVGIDGKTIAAVGDRGELVRRFPDASVENFGPAAILPGFVNCHSHLEITSMRGALDDVEHDFRSWLLKLNEIRQGLSPANIEAAAMLGATEGASAGVTCFGDIGRYGEAGLNALKGVGLRGVLFQETEFSPDNATAAVDFEKLKLKFLLLREQATDLVEVGLSPHSPYTVSRELFGLIADFALAEKIKITIHAAESADEEALMQRGEGFFIDFYSRMELNWEVPHCSPLEFLSATGVLAARPLLAHCVRVSESDIDLITSSGSSIAHCPKSNAKFGHGYAPFEKFLNSGIAVGLGSDSVASNNVCDLLEESRFAVLSARNRPDSDRFITSREVLESATLGGAKALGLDHKIGTLETGKEADIAVVSLKSPAQLPIGDVEPTLVFSSNARDVVMTMVAGKVVYSHQDRFINCLQL